MPVFTCLSDFLPRPKEHEPFNQTVYIAGPVLQAVADHSPLPEAPAAGVCRFLAKVGEFERYRRSVAATTSLCCGQVADAESFAYKGAFW